MAPHSVDSKQIGVACNRKPELSGPKSSFMVEAHVCCDWSRESESSVLVREKATTLQCWLGSYCKLLKTSCQ